MYSLPCVMLGIGSKSATKLTLFVLKWDRAEGQPRSRRGVSPSGIHRCKEEADRQLAGQLAQQIPSGGAAECHEGTSPTVLLQQFIVLCCHVVCIRFPQVELLNATKVRLLQYCYSSS